MKMMRILRGYDWRIGPSKGVQGQLKVRLEPKEARDSRLDPQPVSGGEACHVPRSPSFAVRVCHKETIFSDRFDDAPNVRVLKARKNGVATAAPAIEKLPA